MKIFITGSTTGLGLLAGQTLLKEGHDVVLHARNSKSQMDENFSYLIGGLNNLSEVKSIALEANARGPFDVIIHNAGVYTASSDELFAVNVLAPYVLSALMNRPKRMVFMSSRLHLAGALNFDSHKCNYNDTKLFDLILAKWFARQWPDAFINAVDPGWVPTRMGGAGAPDDLVKGAQTQVWLSGSNDQAALVSGKYFHHLKQQRSNPIADSLSAQDDLVDYLNQKISGEV